MNPETRPDASRKRNRTAWAIIVTVLLALVVGFGVIKLNERVTDAALKSKLEATIRREVKLLDCDLSELRVHNLKVTRRGDKVSFAGTIVAPRGRFVVTRAIWQINKSFAFEPTGEAIFPVIGEANMTREQLSSARFLGEIRPVWSAVKWQIPGKDDRLDEANRESFLREGGANALFDSQFDDFRDDYSHHNLTGYFLLGADVLSVLVQERRYPEAAEAFMGHTGWLLGHDDLRQEFLPVHLADIRQGLVKQNSPESRKLLKELDIHVIRWKRGDFAPPNDLIRTGPHRVH